MTARDGFRAWGLEAGCRGCHILGFEGAGAAGGVLVERPWGPH